MRKYKFQNDGFTFIRISKNKARIAYDNGLTVIFCPVNLQPFGPGHPECDITKKPDFVPCYLGDPENEFEYHVNCFEIWNCINSKTGRYAAFYIPVTRNPWYTDPDLQIEYDYSYMTGGKHETE